MKRIMILLMVFVFLTNTYIYAAAPEVGALGAILTDKESGRVLWQKNGDTPLAPASTTKIMTAVIALENAELSDVITVTDEAAAAPKVKMYLSAGEEITVEQLLYALMLQSSNDAAIALAIGISGSTEAFCKKMTEKAALLGCRDTVFETPNGLDTANHHSTPHDLATIAAYALDNPDFVRIIGTREVSFTTNKKTYHITNKDRFLSEYNGAIGIKTGFTGKAGHCFVGAATRGGRTLISVVLASGWGNTGKERKWSDTKKIMDYGFENYHYTQLVNKGALVKNVKVNKGRAKTVPLVLAEDYGTLMRTDEKYSLSLDYPTELTAPVTKGCRYGTARILTDGVPTAEIPVIAAEDVNGMRFRDNLSDILKSWAKNTVTVLPDP